MLTGATNFRDLGGLPVAGGRRVRHGRIYRSNNLARLTDDDVSTIEGLGLRTVVDLRTEAERLRNPTRGLWDAVTTVTSAKRDTAEMLASLIGAGEGDDAALLERFSAFYARMPDLYADEYGAMFGALAAGETPLLVNCSAGKDRTGVAVMLIMVALKVDHDAIIADYMLSGARLPSGPGFTDMLSATAAERFGRLSPKARAVMLGVDPGHIEAALEAVRRDYGSAQGYLIDRLGLTADAIRAMRHHLTEDVHESGREP
jgi:protein-tyrosine phosphatase